MPALNILISEPIFQPHIPYLPYMWAILKTYCEKNTDLDGTNVIGPEARRTIGGFLAHSQDKSWVGFWS